jgi:hypothetical protein
MIYREGEWPRAQQDRADSQYNQAGRGGKSG